MFLGREARVTSQFAHTLAMQLEYYDANSYYLATKGVTIMAGGGPLTYTPVSSSLFADPKSNLGLKQTVSESDDGSSKVVTTAADLSTGNFAQVTATDYALYPSPELGSTPVTDGVPEILNLEFGNVTSGYTLFGSATKAYGTEANPEYNLGSVGFNVFEMTDTGTDALGNTVQNLQLVQVTQFTPSQYGLIDSVETYVDVDVLIASEPGVIFGGDGFVDSLVTYVTGKDYNNDGVTDSDALFYMRDVSVGFFNEDPFFEGPMQIGVDTSAHVETSLFDGYVDGVTGGFVLLDTDPIFEFDKVVAIGTSFNALDVAAKLPVLGGINVGGANNALTIQNNFAPELVA